VLEVLEVAQILIHHTNQCVLPRRPEYPAELTRIKIKLLASSGRVDEVVDPLMCLACTAEHADVICPYRNPQ
jgi:hypothetical protein